MTPPCPPPARRLENRFATLVILALLPCAAVLGWRAMCVIAGVLVAHAVARRVLRTREPPSTGWPRELPLDALLLCGLLPAELAGGSTSADPPAPLWPLIPGLAIAVALLRRARAALPDLPFDPVVVALLVAHAAVGSATLAPGGSLRRAMIFEGDALRAAERGPPEEPWYRATAASEAPAVRVPWAGERLAQYLSGASTAARSPGGANLDALIRDELPPLEDLVLIGHPMPIGQTSGVVLLGVVLWGAYRRRIDWRVPIVAISCAYLALLLLAVPTSVTERGGNWRFLAAARADVGPATALTFAHFLIFASPMTYALGLLATRGDVRPLQPRAIVVWSAGLGVATAAGTLYVSVTAGPLVALLFAPLVGRWLDRALARRPMKLPT